MTSRIFDWTNTLVILLTLGLDAVPAAGASLAVEGPDAPLVSFRPSGGAGAFDVDPTAWAGLTCAQRRQALHSLAQQDGDPAPVRVFVAGRRVASCDGRLAVFYPDLRRGDQHDLQMIAATNDPVPLDRPPTLVSMPAPVYPVSARQQGVEGSLWLRALVGVQGRIEEIVLPQGSDVPGLSEAAIAAAREAVFEPARRANEPIAVWTLLPFEFVLE